MSAARKFIARPARYIFQASESHLIRFAPMETRGISAKAVIRDLSESGLSFTLPISEPIDMLPDEGEPLKVEFPIPGRAQIACFATVTRVEQRTEWIPEWGDRGYHLIALQFRHLPTLHLRAIQNGLQGRTSEDPELNFQTLKRTHAFAFAGMSIALTMCMFAMATPITTWVQIFQK
jgi:hypothetical protein